MKFLIDFADSASQQEIDSWMTQNNVTSYSTMNALNGVYIVECAVAPTSTEIVETIVEDQNVSAQLLNTVEIIPASTGEVSTFSHDTDWWKTASAYEIDFNVDSSTFVKRGAKTSVYVVDSGIFAGHSEFEGVNIQNVFSFNGDFEDTNGHGTAIASVVAGKSLGIANSTVKVVKVFDSSKTTMLSDLVQAFDAILADILANPGSMPIVNISWAISKNEYIESKIQELINAGAFVVVSAGNNGTPIQNVTPASMESVLTIGAYDENFEPANFSNYTSATSNTAGETNYGALDGWAPGTNIASALIDGNVGLVAGTSIAAGIMTACLAYNSDILYSNVGYTASVKFFLEMYGMLKKNMLTLPAPYDASINRVATFVTKATTTMTSGSLRVSRVAYDNVDMHGFLVAAPYTTKVELDGELPEGLSLSNGWIVGRLVSAPVDSQTLTYTVTVTHDGGEVNTYPLTLYLARAGTPPGDYPVDIFPQIPQQNYCGNYCDGPCDGTCTSCDKTDCRCNEYCP